MQILLNEKVEKLGRRGDVVTVKPGYFRNYLLPNGLAVPATDSVMKLVEARSAKLKREKEELLGTAQEGVDKLKGLKVVLKKKATKNGKLYAAVAVSEILDEVKKESGVELDESFLEEKSIKELGEHVLKVNLGEGFEQEITVVVETE